MSRRSVLRTERKQVFLDRFHEGGSSPDDDAPQHHHDAPEGEGFREGQEPAASDTDDPLK